jgi:pentatricopeptide repeat protein
MMLADFPSVLPDASTFNAIMTLYLRKGNTEMVFKLFEQLVANGRSGPDSYSVNLLLKAKTQTPSMMTLNGMEDVEELLLGMKSVYHVRPTAQSFNIVIDAWAKTNMPEAANRAEALLDAMEKKCRSGDMTAVPDSYTFTSLLNAISRAKFHSAKGSWAEQVFRRMKRMHEEGLVEAPTVPVYNAVLNALITSNERGAQVRAKVFFADMNRGKIQMANNRSFNIMIKSHSITFENADGITTSFARPSKAKALLYQMEQSNAVSPDVYSYTTVICAYSRSNVKKCVTLC